MAIESALDKLNEKERMIVVKRFFDGRTQMEVANEIEFHKRKCHD